MSETTFGIIKPDAVQKGFTGEILSMIEKNGFRIVGLKKVRLNKEKAEGFYFVHRERPFFNSLTDFMSEGPIVVMVLEKENAIGDWRKLMGATNPADAESGTIRKTFAENIERNAVHGSDSPESAAIEIPYFFNQLELV
ncbi:MAG: nucleoside-diphosphate kinase [Acidobacteria bacterium CG_4_9_14_3_um_filter_49_7]|nr:MAG: nucleoside-diphosphate kinase [Acidobacteria bacterium CG_4_9_14_3_um_filter_49_7]